MKTTLTKSPDFGRGRRASGEVCRASGFWLLCVSLVAIVVLQLYVQFRFNYWNRDPRPAKETGILAHSLTLRKLCTRRHLGLRAHDCASSMAGMADN
jgi:hypothetical protein